MNRNPDTPAFMSVPGHTRLYRRHNGVYYIRAKVPKVLRPIVNRTEIRKSLATADYRQALAKVKVESIRVDILFRDARAMLTPQTPAPARLSQDEMIWLVSDWLVKEECRAEEWTERELPALAPLEKEDIADSLKCDAAVLTKSPAFACYDDDGSTELDALLSGDGKRWNIEKGSEDYAKLLPLMRRAKVETLCRTIDRIEGRKFHAHDARLEDVHSHTQLPPPPRQTMLLGKFLDDFMDYQRRAHTETTPASYALPVRSLREMLGERAPLHMISRQQMEKVCAVLGELPKNMAQRYPGASLEDATAAAKRENYTEKRSARTLANEYTSLVAIFNYAVDDGLITENPAKGRKLRETFKLTKRNKRELFTPEELQKIFSAPLLTGCADDERGFATPGKNKPRRGRFLVPLLALFHGCRMNELCQLYTEDVKDEGGIAYLHIRGDLDDADETDKRVKNESSWRKVPIHPEILRLGFLKYVAERRRDESSPRLFPSLTKHKQTGRFSHPFSKWFTKFLVAALGYKPKASFHVFRHHFRTACIAAQISMETAEALGGWKNESSSESEYRHAQMPVLRDAIAKIVYPGLNLSHLCPVQPGCADVSACRVRRRLRGK